MFKKILFCLVMLSTGALANKDMIIQSLSPALGEIIHPDDISKTPFDGVYEVIRHSPIQAILVSADGRYVIEGNVIDLTTRKIMPSAQVQQLKKTLLDGIDEADKIIFKADNEKHIIHIFTDVDCPFCKKIHSEMSKINALGITVKYLASPLASLHPTAQNSMEKIWCAADRIKAIDNYKKYNIIPDSKPCDNPVAQQLTIAQQLGVNGTPAIFLKDGSEISGYRPAGELLKIIKSRK